MASPAMINMWGTTLRVCGLYFDKDMWTKVMKDGNVYAIVSYNDELMGWSEELRDVLLEYSNYSLFGARVNYIVKRLQEDGYECKHEEA